ncbi:nucleobase transmembrane transporter [Schizosaccharomyces pombe]|uniref:Putative purine permease C1399.01c n=1 Tax=Schizosaccharomyces pombe (strain 972 / ATCC 24843) TaxID=284812 RepID=YI31_SCHPO|nr:putative transporter [Schizosaccharomyces pombe]Q9HE12.1 RecName: Full=Putative purine permease C1399.01c [Schizosaccharomyces pombe 972h-]CAC19746.1 membrane transporter (predicted) [Schizosaccharomyces pombe]|eukprot:NP_593513.1 putative transporter [Schizosaccharomyces pombe]
MSESIQDQDHEKTTIIEKTRRFVLSIFTKDFWIGDYDYSFLLPAIPFTKQKPKSPPFFSLNAKVPVLLALLLGFQHALAMVGGVTSPPRIIAASANLTTEQTNYLVSAGLISSGIMTLIQIARVHIPKTKYYIGTGMLSVLGISFTSVSVAPKVLSQMYENGYCPKDENGTKLPCPDGYGAFLATACVCSLLEIFMSFIPPRILKRLFPPIVTGPVVLLIGTSLISSGLNDWAGGEGSCTGRPTEAEAPGYSLCPSDTSPHALGWGSAQFIGLGFSVFATIIIIERFGPPLMKTTSVVLGLVVGMIISAATGYWDHSIIDAAPVVTFNWVHTFRLRIYGPAVLPMLALYIVNMMEAIGDIGATSDVSMLEVDGPAFDARVQGGILGDGLASLIASLMTTTPLTTFAQNNGVISLTKCANRRAGFFCAVILFFMGLFAKFAAVFVAIPSPVLGGMTTFLFSSVAVSGIAIISQIPFNRRNRFILTASMTLGMGAILVPDWFTYFFEYSGPNKALVGFLDAITLVMENGFAIGAFISIFLNLILPYEFDPDLTNDSPGLSTTNGVNNGIVEVRGIDPNDSLSNTDTEYANENKKDEVDVDKVV